jgi:hypothetical protein
MNLANLEQKLIAAARKMPPPDLVPYAFEKRIMALIAEKPVDVLAVWSRALWRAAASCVAVMVLLGAISLFTPVANSSAGDLSQDFENTLLAAVDQPALDQPDEVR